MLSCSFCGLDQDAPALPYAAWAAARFMVSARTL